MQVIKRDNVNIVESEGKIVTDANYVDIEIEEGTEVITAVKVTRREQGEERGRVTIHINPKGRTRIILKNAEEVQLEVIGEDKEKPLTILIKKE